MIRIAALVLMLLVLGPVSAQDAEREPGPADLEEAIEIAEALYGGDMNRAETVVREGREVHEIRLYDEAAGTVRTVWIDPDTGLVVQPRRR
jgi:uncharacterized membrane protein YkoI